MEFVGGPKITIGYDDIPPEGNAPPRRQKPDALATCALVLGIVSCLFAGVALGPVAILCGVTALVRQRSTGVGSGRAAAGIVLGLAGTLIWIGLVWWFVSQREDPRQESQAPYSGMETTGADLGAIERAPLPLRRALMAHTSLAVEEQGKAGWSTVASGSGAVIASRGGRAYILTCRHVVEPASQGSSRRVRARWAGSGELAATVEWSAPARLDLAIVSAVVPAGEKAPEPPPAGDPGQVSIGELVFAVGDPLNFRTSLARGVIASVRQLEGSTPPVKVFQSQVPLNPGNSGGGLYRETGELIAINSWTMPKDKAEGLGFSISIENLGGALAGAPSELVSAVEAWLRGAAAESAGAPADRGR